MDSVATLNASAASQCNIRERSSVADVSDVGKSLLGVAMAKNAPRPLASATGICLASTPFGLASYADAQIHGRVPRMEFSGRRVTVLGLGRHGGGVGAARFLAEQGAIVTVTDRSTGNQLAESVAALANCPIAKWRLGGHDERDFQVAELIVVNPAVPPDNRWLELATAAGIPITTEIELFLERCPAKIAGVTGSNGKSSTTAMLAEILSAAGHKVWLGGNIGRSLLPKLSLIQPDDAVVLELSSFQLARLSERCRGIDLAVVTNCAPNHLDWHGTYDDYRAAKQRLLELQSVTSTTVINTEDPETSSWSSQVRGELLRPLPDHRIPPLAIAGRHQRQNARLAAAAAQAWGANSTSIDTGLRQFAGLPHRLERIATIDDRAFYNDSLATTPESTCAALDSFDEPVWLLAGGYDKGVDLNELGRWIVRRTAGAAFYGAVGDTLLATTLQSSGDFCATRVNTLEQALEWCWQRSQPGDVVLLSPACASYDQFRDYADRAEHFRRAVARLASKSCLL